MIREEEPPKPSTRLSDSGEALASISAHRADGAGQADEAGPRRAGLDRDEVPGEGPQPPLRDGQRPSRRTCSVTCGRAGAGVPALGRVSAAKIARRHKRPVLALSLVVLALVGGIIGTTWGLIGAEQARQAEAGQRALADANEQKGSGRRRGLPRRCGISCSATCSGRRTRPSRLTPCDERAAGSTRLRIRPSRNC